jgi:hypothetical protein
MSDMDELRVVSVKAEKVEQMIKDQYHAHIRLSRFPIMNQMNPIHTMLSCLSVIHF